VVTIDDQNQEENNNTEQTALSDEDVSKTDNKVQTEPEVATEKDSVSDQKASEPNKQTDEHHKKAIKAEHYIPRVSDTISVAVKIKEGDKERLQNFEGVVIAMKGKQESRTMTVRKISVNSIGVERTWPLDCPSIASVKMVKTGKFSKSKLYYLRDKIGKEALRIKEATPKPAVI
jgi:large subunit ribosomal protein L19